ncbi:hypothetical protein HRbin33_00321 [bacterium HR33]|nr:hypothetical protein HRbin33_00321 [bacterium HR33]
MNFPAMILRLLVLFVSLSFGLAACRQPPEVTIRVQGLVRTLGLQEPVAGALITVEWPAALGGGQSQIRTNSAGQYAVQRTLRAEQPSCEGIAITVEAEGYASIYDRRSDSDCEGGLIRKDFTLYPVPR